MKEFLKVHQYNSFSANTPFQYAFSIIINDREEYLQLGNFLQSKRDFFTKQMSQTKFKPLPSHGSYFQLYSYGDISNESESDFAKKLTKEAGVATIPVSAFYQKGKEDKVLRFCFAKNENTLFEAVKRLTAYSL
jgi:methionine aminotransferase